MFYAQSMVLVAVVITLIVVVVLYLHMLRKNCITDWPHQKILIITRENRNHTFVTEHDINIEKYCRRHDYTYKRIRTECSNLPIYWCKIQDLLNHISGYDYVVWLDSDTHINHMDRPLESIIRKDITIGQDHHQKVYNAGFFVVKNSKVGRQFLQDCLQYFEDHRDSCVDKNGRLLGKWSGVCYEQGVMNILLKSKYKNNVHVTRDVSNSIYCNDSVMITHLFRSSPEQRLRCMQRRIKI